MGRAQVLPDRFAPDTVVSAILALLAAIFTHPTHPVHTAPGFVEWDCNRPAVCIILARLHPNDDVILTHWEDRHQREEWGR